MTGNVGPVIRLGESVAGAPAGVYGACCRLAWLIRLVPYDQLMRRRITLRGSWMASNETAYSIWRQVQAGLLDLSAPDVTTASLDDPDAVLARAETTSGLGFVALMP